MKTKKVVFLQVGNTKTIYFDGVASKGCFVLEIKDGIKDGTTSTGPFPTREDAIQEGNESWPYHKWVND